jgi:hypothetical protein
MFEGAKNKIVKTLKLASIANLGFAVASGTPALAPCQRRICRSLALCARATVPLLQYITAASGASGKGVAMSMLLLSFGGGTTGALTWATSTYVLTITSIPGKEAMIIETPTLTGGSTTTEVAWADITRPLGYHPFATFEAKGNKYYLDELGEMHDEQFMEKLEKAINK